MTEMPHRVSVTAVIIFYAVLAGGGVVVARLFFDINPCMPFSGREDDPLFSLALGAGIGLVLVAASRGLDALFEWSRALSRSLKEIIGNATHSDVVVLALASAIGEEILFRGVLLPTTGLWISSIVFGLAHGFAPGRPTQMWAMLKQFFPLVVAATLIGFAFGTMVEYTGSILGPIVAHFTVNYLNLCFMYKSQWKQQHHEDQGE